jgi:putative oxidoreductase
MKLFRRIPGALMAPMFIAGGWDAVMHPEGKAGKASVVTERVIEAADLDTDTEQLVRINGAVQLVAGVMLASGILPRVAAATLAGSLVPTTLAGHRFWAEEDPQDRRMHQVQFLKNTAMFAGLLLVVVDGGGGSAGRHRHD